MSDDYSSEALVESFIEKQTVAAMKVSLEMIRSFTELNEGRHELSRGCWIDLYSYEPLEWGKEELLRVVSALLMLSDPKFLNWEFRLFASDGMITTMADGSKPPDSDETGFALISDAQ